MHRITYMKLKNLIQNLTYIFLQNNSLEYVINSEVQFNRYSAHIVTSKFNNFQEIFQNSYAHTYVDVRLTFSNY